MKKVMKDIFLRYPEKLHELHNNFTIFIRKSEKPVANFHDKKEYVIYMRNLKQPLNHGLVLKKVHRIILSLITG